MLRRAARAVPLALLALAGCRTREAYLTPYDLRWTGPVTPEGGPHCEAATHGTLTMISKDRAVTFAPNDGVLVLHGAVAPDGTVHAALDITGSSHRSFPLRLDGTLTQAGVTGTYTTAHCRWRVDLHPPKPLPARIFAPGNILGIGK